MVEVKSPKHYTIGEPVKITLEYDDNGKIVASLNEDENVSNYALFAKEVSDAEDHVLDYINRLTEYKLPDTGGIGTLWFYIIGAIVAGTAVTIIVARKKYKNKINKDVA